MVVGAILQQLLGCSKNSPRNDRMTVTSWRAREYEFLTAPRTIGAQADDTSDYHPREFRCKLVSRKLFAHLIVFHVSSSDRVAQPLRRLLGLLHGNESLEPLATGMRMCSQMSLKEEVGF